MRIASPILLACFAVLAGCSQPTVRSEIEMFAYVKAPDHGLIQRSEKGAWVVEVAYKPKDLIVLQNLDELDPDLAREADSIRQSLSMYDYFTLYISRGNQEVLASEDNYARVSHYLAFEIGKDLSLVHEADTFAVEDFMYGATHGASSASAVILAFRSNTLSKTGAFKILYDDTFFGTGHHTFTFLADDIKKIPSLDFKNLDP